MLNIKAANAREQIFYLIFSFGERFDDLKKTGWAMPDIEQQVLASAFENYSLS